MQFRKFLIVPALLVGLMLSSNKAAFGWGSTGGDGSRYTQLQETAVFFNNSGIALSAGHVVVLDTAGTGVTSGTTLGAYVDVVVANDSVLAVGVVKSASSNQTPVVVVTKGPVPTRCADSADAVSINTAVGTTNQDESGSVSANGGLCGGGTNLGIALEAGDATNTEADLVIWVSPTGAD